MLGQAERLYELNSLTQTKTENSVRAKILSVVSGKGGTGKSFVASNLAYQLASSGKKVLLVDCDINMSNQEIFFNTSSRNTLYHYLLYNQNLDDVIYKHTNNLHLIFGESGKIDHPNLLNDRIKNLFIDLENLSEIYDVILLDTASGSSSGTIQLIKECDEILFVISPEPTSVMDAYVVMKMLKSEGSVPKAQVVVNKSFNRDEAIESFENLNLAVNHFLNLEMNYLGELPFSEQVISSIRSQKLFSEVFHKHIISKKFHEFSRLLKIPTIG